MTIPLATTTVTVRKPVESGTRDPYETAATFTTLATGVRAVIGGPSFREQFIGGQQQVITNHLTADPVEGMDGTCLVDDERTGLTFEVVGAAERGGLGLDHLTASLRLVIGEAAR